MTWRDHTWEFVIGALSWLVAIIALAGLVALAVYASRERRRKVRS